MLASEYILIDISLLSSSFGRDDYSQALEFNLSIISLLSIIPNLRDGLK